MTEQELQELEAKTTALEKRADEARKDLDYYVGDMVDSAFLDEASGALRAAFQEIRRLQGRVECLEADLAYEMGC